jgi:predicted phosphodiesterase
MSKSIKPSDLEKVLNKHNISKKELDIILTQNKTGNPYEHKDIKLGKNNISFGIISDTHIGHKKYNSNYLDFAVKQFNKEKVDFVTHCGDITDGCYLSRPGQIYELNHLGADNQVNAALEELVKIEQPLYFISGNHENNTFYNLVGYDIGKKIEQDLKNKNKNVTYLGRDSGKLILPCKASIELSHPQTGNSYALSYRLQKTIDALTGGEKPSVFIQGHTHKAFYMFYRNIHAIQAGTLQDQSGFMKTKEIAAHTGFWIINMSANNNGEISSFEPKFFPFYK